MTTAQTRLSNRPLASEDRARRSAARIDRNDQARIRRASLQCDPGASEKIKEDGAVKFRTFYSSACSRRPPGSITMRRQPGASPVITEARSKPWTHVRRRLLRAKCSPGREDPADYSPWYRICKSLGLDHQDWTNPTTQVRVGLTDLELGARSITKRFKDLFQKRGDWRLRMAVLERFAHGGGHVAQLLKKHQAKLANLPEVGADGGSPRWEYLRRFAADDFDPSNVDAYMAVAKTLGYKPAP